MSAAAVGWRSSSPSVPGTSWPYHRSAPEDAPPYTHLTDASNGRVVLPLLLWRRGPGRGGPSPFSRLRFVATFQRVAAPIYLACWLRTTTSSPCPSPPKEERETALRPVSTEMRVRCCARGRAHSYPVAFGGGTDKMRPFAALSVAMKRSRAGRVSQHAVVL
jgi:hypothetical protein